jgi:predicted HTH domain antitoxin
MKQTVRTHLKHEGVRLRPKRALEGVLGDEAVRLYVEEQLSLAKVAGRLGVSADAVRRVLVQLGIERRDRYQK